MLKTCRHEHKEGIEFGLDDQPLSRRKEGYLAALREALNDLPGHRKSR
jgi:hypothetical protein